MITAPRQHLGPVAFALGNLSAPDYVAAQAETIPYEILTALVPRPGDVAATTMTGIDGHTAYALPHDQLRALLTKYGRLAK